MRVKVRVWLAEADLELQTLPPLELPQSAPVYGCSANWELETGALRLDQMLRSYSADRFPLQVHAARREK